MNKIELITQPEQDSEQQKTSISPTTSTLKKLKDLVEGNPAPNDNSSTGDNGTKTESDMVKSESRRSPSPSRQHSHSIRQAYQKYSENSHEDDNTKNNKEYDHDGFEIPPGKVPLDGHFSTNEVKELVKIAKDEGLLNQNVDVKVLEKNEKIGDKLIISDKNNKENSEQG